MRVSTSWTSKRTRESGVERSRGVSEALFVACMRVFAKEVGEKVGARRVAVSR